MSHTPEFVYLFRVNYGREDGDFIESVHATKTGAELARLEYERKDLQEYHGTHSYKSLEIDEMELLP